MALLKIAITKSKGNVEIDTDKLPDAVYQEALALGLKTLVNRGTSKITKSTYPVEAELKAAAQAKALEQVEAVLAGKIKFTGAKKATGASGAVMTEARRLARNYVKDGMKTAGIKISHVEASEITKAANALLEADPSIIEKATANIAEREATPAAAKIDIKSLISVSPELVAKAEAKKAKAKETLSAKQAGMTVTAKGKGKGKPAPKTAPAAEVQASA